MNNEDDNEYERVYAESFRGRHDALLEAWRELFEVIAHEIRNSRVIAWLECKLTKGGE